ncbi:phage terminase large subunit [Chromatium okenii]|jgi:PBSX family phage terminase large subunit|uniref:phage terminase large subunit n=1 Tax=Chromatium okenii TaxID=61644 RepID=UPI0026EDC438|nr:phage terminase large subunit [Chromatium okenii]MBV5309297.1 phage terminase large subunit [Chromatium okenii]
MPDIPLTLPQRQFVFSEEPYPAIVGGLGSGKTRAGTMRAVLLLLQNKGVNVGIFLPTYDLLRLRAMPGVEEDLAMMGLKFHVNKSEFKIDVAGYGFIIFRSYDNPSKIVSFEVAHSIVDEIDTLPMDKAALVWRKITERTRQKFDGKNTIGVVTTPDNGINGFVYHKWVKLQQKGYVLYKASTYSNPFLPKDYAEQILANYDPVLAELYLLGDFVSLNKNKVYHFFDRKKHHVQRVLNEHDTLIHIGLDFNIGGTCAVVFVIDNNVPIAVDEFVSHDTQDFINNLTRYENKKIIIYPDASGKASRTNASQSDIGMIRQAGYQLQYNPINPAVRDRINSYNGLLSHGRFFINTDKCPNLTNALETQGYDDRLEPEKFNTHPAIDDWVDSSGYFIAFKFPVIHNRPNLAQITGI